MSDKKSGYSEEKEDWLGNKYTQHYDGDGNKSGWSEQKEDWLGNSYTQSYDNESSKSGWSESKEDWIGNSYTQSYDNESTKTGWSEGKEDWLGNSYHQNYDNDSNKTGWSEDKEDWIGNEYTQHYGHGGHSGPGKQSTHGGDARSIRSGGSSYTSSRSDYSGNSSGGYSGNYSGGASGGVIDGALGFLFWAFVVLIGGGIVITVVIGIAMWTAGLAFSEAAPGGSGRETRQSGPAVPPRYVRSETTSAPGSAKSGNALVEFPAGNMEKMDITMAVDTKNDSGLHLRAGRDLESDSVTFVPEGGNLKLISYDDRYEVINGRRGRWCWVSANGQEGWVWEHYIYRADENRAPVIQNNENSGDTYLVDTKDDSGLHLRSDKDLGSASVTFVAEGGRVSMRYCEEELDIVNGREGRWCRVAANGKEGWAWGWYIKK